MNNRAENNYVEKKSVQKLFLIIAAGEFLMGCPYQALGALIVSICLDSAIEAANAASPYLQEGAKKTYTFFQSFAEKPANVPAPTPSIMTLAANMMRHR